MHHGHCSCWPVPAVIVQHCFVLLKLLAVHPADRSAAAPLSAAVWHWPQLWQKLARLDRPSAALSLAAGVTLTFSLLTVAGEEDRLCCEMHGM